MPIHPPPHPGCQGLLSTSRVQMSTLSNKVHIPRDPYDLQHAGMENSLPSWCLVRPQNQISFCVLEERPCGSQRAGIDVPVPSSFLAFSFPRILVAPKLACSALSLQVNLCLPNIQVRSQTSCGCFITFPWPASLSLTAQVTLWRKGLPAAALYLLVPLTCSVLSFGFLSIICWKWMRVNVRIFSFLISSQKVLGHSLTVHFSLSWFLNLNSRIMRVLNVLSSTVLGLFDGCYLLHSI